eukprot:TRINITY_DN847_c0_g1_i13.p1 TRINITY_DN847_c0_g1~~TRINITY_DN847_c0_g1_i13.p1  ORF type:complete len:217 (+),score=39.58 TRINITY_DN847_c0_g1_i13:182-832(+)
MCIRDRGQVRVMLRCGDAKSCVEFCIGRCNSVLVAAKLCAIGNRSLSTLTLGFASIGLSLTQASGGLGEWSDASPYNSSCFNVAIMTWTATIGEKLENLVPSPGFAENFSQAFMGNLQLMGNLSLVLGTGDRRAATLHVVFAESTLYVDGEPQGGGGHGGQDSHASTDLIVVLCVSFGVVVAGVVAGAIALKWYRASKLRSADQREAQHQLISDHS